MRRRVAGATAPGTSRRQRWDDIAFLHWSYPAEVVQPLLPRGFEVETLDGAAWVGLTPFRIRVRPFGVPLVLPGVAFPETNHRTYVVDRHGRQGLVFLRMQVTSRWFAALLRTLGLQ